MVLTELRIENFRNLKKIILSVTEAGIFFWGNNGQGKTNIIEAIHFLGSALSFRGARILDALPWSGDEPLSVSIKYVIPERRSISLIKYLQLNKTEGLKRSTDEGPFSMIVFAPAELERFYTNTDYRRRYIDRLLTLIRPGYRTELRALNEILEQRNALLKKIVRGQGAEWELDYWEESLARVATQVNRERKKIIGLLNQSEWKKSSTKFLSRTGLDAPLAWAVRGISAEIDDVREMIKLIKASRRADLKLGYSTIGPQRDDFSLNLVSGQPFTRVASRGQLRLALVALKLYEMKLCEQFYETAPILLFDDVLSELDQGSQELLIEEVAGRQLFVTGITVCDTSPKVKKMATYQVFKGNINEIA